MITVYDMASGQLVSVESEQGQKSRRREHGGREPTRLALQEHSTETPPGQDIPTDLAAMDCEIFVRLMERQTARNDSR